LSLIAVMFIIVTQRLHKDSNEVLVLVLDSHVLVLVKFFAGMGSGWHSGIIS